MQNKKQGKGTTVSIKAKILGAIIPITALLVVVMIVLAYTISSSIIKSNATQMLDSSISYQAAKIAAWLDENLAAFSTVKNTIEKTNPTDAELQSIIDSTYDYNSNYPNGLYLSDLSGNVVKASDSTQTFSDVTNSTWFKEGLSRVNMAYGSAHQNDEGTNIVSASAIVDDGTGNIRVISADVSLERITVIVNSFVEMNDAESFLVNSDDMTILAHRDSSLISTTLTTSNSDKFLAEVAQKLEDRDYSNCDIQGNLTGFETVAGTNWILVSYVTHDVIYSDVRSLRTKMILIAIIALIVLIVLVERVIHYVIKPVHSLTDVITTMTDGDFTVGVDVSGRDEIGKMGRSVQGFLASMRNMLNEIQNISHKVSEGSDLTNNLSVEMSEISEIQAESMRELNETVDQLSLSINDIADNATHLAQVVADTKDTSIEVQDFMKKTVEVSEKGQSDMRRVNDAMDNISASIERLDASIANVGKASNEITDIVGVIGNIADETNLLSLNASIEAARAGEAGKGFAVVATQIGKLAQTSGQSVANIEQLIEEITKLVNETVAQASDSMDSIKESSNMINTALATFEEIFNDIHQTQGFIVDMMLKVDQVDDVATNMAAISEEQAASAEEIHATSEDMVIQAQNIAGSSNNVRENAHELSEGTENLQASINKFRI